jgi:hypothetical protein
VVDERVGPELVVELVALLDDARLDRDDLGPGFVTSRMTPR